MKLCFVTKTADVKTKLWYSIKDFYVMCPVLVKNLDLFLDVKHINAECSYTVFSTAVGIFQVYLHEQ
jgi:hypothetical protein